MPCSEVEVWAPCPGTGHRRVWSCVSCWSWRDSPVQAGGRLLSKGGYDGIGLGRQSVQLGGQLRDLAEVLLD